MRFPKQTAALTFAGLLAGLGASFAITPRYVATAVMKLEDRTHNAKTAETHRTLREQFERRRFEVLSAFAKPPEELRITPVDDSDSVFRIDATDSDSNGSRMLANAVISHLIDQYRGGLRDALAEQSAERDRVLETRIVELRARLAVLEARVGAPVREATVHTRATPPREENPKSPVELELLDAPAVHQSFPSRSMFLLTGGLIGFLAGAWRGFR